MCHLPTPVRRAPRGVAWAAACACLLAPVASAGQAAAGKAGSTNVVNDLKLRPENEKKAEALARYAAGALYELRREPERALAEYEAALRADPGHAQLATKVGAEYLRRRKTDKALPILEAAAAANPKHYEIHMLLGLACQAANQKAKALAANKKANELDPAQIVPYQSLAGHYLKENKVAEAVRVLERGFKQKTDDVRFWIGLGDLYAVVMKLPAAVKAAQTISGGKLKTDRAVECYEKAQKLAPQDLGVTSRQADYYVSCNQADKGIALYKTILEKRPDALDVRERLAYAYAAKKDLASAIGQFEELVKRQPLNWLVYSRLGNFHEESKDYDRAQANYEQALILNPKEQELYLRLARLHLARQKPDEAMKLLDRCRDRFPESARVPYFYGLIHSNRKDYPRALASFAEAENMAKAKEDQKDLLDSSFYFYYGAACERAGQFDRAVALFRECIKLNPENDEALNYLGYMFAEKGVNLKEAESLVKEALKSEPKNGAYLDSLGWIYFRLGRLREALKFVSEAAQTEAAKEDATVFEHLAEIHLKMGRKDLALEQLRKGLKVEPDNKKVADQLKQLEGKSAPPKAR